MFRVIVVALLLIPNAVASCLAGDQWSLNQTDGQIEIRCNDQFVANYVQRSATKPIIWPIIGPTGAEMTRAYPMRPNTAGEKHDHIHHRSLWFTYGDVNGISFWHEEGKEKPGIIAHREYKKIAGGDRGVIETVNDWNSPEGEQVCSDERTIEFSREQGSLVIDFRLRLIASVGKVTLGDTKEGAFGVRVPSSMDVDAKQGGTIVNSESQTNAATWGQKASWVDYFGPVADKTCGIAILNHPSSFRYPNRWHVRTYGLFAANPFGEKDFPGGNKAEGTHVLEKDESLTLRYRVIFHAGNHEDAKVAEAFARYAAEK